VLVKITGFLNNLAHKQTQMTICTEKSCTCTISQSFTILYVLHMINSETWMAGQAGHPGDYLQLLGYMYNNDARRCGIGCASGRRAAARRIRKRRLHLGLIRTVTRVIHWRLWMARSAGDADAHRRHQAQSRGPRAPAARVQQFPHAIASSIRATPTTCWC